MGGTSAGSGTGGRSAAGIFSGFRDGRSSSGIGLIRPLLSGLLSVPPSSAENTWGSEVLALSVMTPNPESSAEKGGTPLERLEFPELFFLDFLLLLISREEKFPKWISNYSCYVYTISTFYLSSSVPSCPWLSNLCAASSKPT